MTCGEAEIRGNERLQAGARRAVGAAVRAGAILYRRDLHLPRLLRLFPGEIPKAEPEATRFVLARLTVAARQERRRARSGHWAYDLNRHIALAQALAAERLALSGRRMPGRQATEASRGQAPDQAVCSLPT